MAALQICESEVIERFAPYLSKNIQQELAQNLLEMSLNDTIYVAAWNRRSYLASEIFKYVLTDEGVCYQFNGLHVEDIYRDSK